MKQFVLTTPEGRQLFYRCTQWRKLRDYKIASQPLCEECLKNNKITPATEIHHIKDIAQVPTIENALDYENLMSLCKSCHSIITIRNQEKQVWKPFNIKEFLLRNNEYI